MSTNSTIEPLFKRLVAVVNEPAFKGLTSHQIVSALTHVTVARIGYLLEKEQSNENDDLAQRLIQALDSYTGYFHETFAGLAETMGILMEFNHETHFEMADQVIN